MRVIDITLRLLRLTDTLAGWRGAIDEADHRRRERIARYADEIASTAMRSPMRPDILAQTSSGAMRTGSRPSRSRATCSGPRPR